MRHDNSRGRSVYHPIGTRKKIHIQGERWASGVFLKGFVEISVDRFFQALGFMTSCRGFFPTMLSARLHGRYPSWDDGTGTGTGSQEELPQNPHSEAAANIFFGPIISLSITIIKIRAEPGGYSTSTLAIPDSFPILRYQTTKG